MIKVFIIEDHPIVIDGIKALVNDSGVAELIGFAKTASESLKLLTSTAADVILLDINLPDMSGIELCKIIHSKYPQLKILTLTTFLQRDFVDKMLENGAMGYVLKNAPGEEIIDGICTVAEGGKFICEAVNLLIKKQDNDTMFLSRREIQILSLIAAGDTTKEIADKLFISVFTVETHRKNLLTKLNARNMVSLIKIAMDYKYI
ncbi:MAG: response regulator transcription factor [Paludibacter sp.]